MRRIVSDEAIPKVHVDKRWGLRRKLRLHCQKTARNDTSQHECLPKE